MKAGPLLTLLALAFASDGNASAQAITNTVQITQQSMDSTKGASQQQSGRISPSGALQPGQGKPGHVQAFYEINRPPLDCHCAKQPILSVKAGEVAPGTLVTITSPSPNAAIYYTTEGWTPTDGSTPYTAPISVSATTRLQVIALEPQLLPSPIVEATYSVKAPIPPLSPNAAANGTVLTKGTSIRLVTASRINSRTASVGDRVYLLLDQNVISGGIIVAPRGMSIDAKLTKVEQAGHSGKSGVLVFQPQSFTARGVTVPLTGVFTLVGPDVAISPDRLPQAMKPKANRA